jgi:PAS domain S-box-containing protein
VISLIDGIYQEASKLTKQESKLAYIPNPTASVMDALKVARQKQKLIIGGTIQWFHWLVILLSILLTVGAWYFSKQQVETATKDRFLKNSTQVVELIKDRMKLYEHALWSSVSLIDSNQGRVNYKQWQDYASSLKLDEFYPGINGIGVIFNIQPTQMKAYLKRERIWRPDYSLYPEHQESEYWPITYIEPEAPNRKAIGLDIAFESNRYSSIKKARDTGTSQLTGPIILVQDTEKTPGFLLYTPFYRAGVEHETVELRRANISGVTYAPFIMKNLMSGMLASENRYVSISISDNEESLYTDNTTSKEFKNEVDPSPLFSQHISVEMYGREWLFDIDSNLRFREANLNFQPYFILGGGLAMDSLLLALFLLLSRANRNALAYAEEVTKELRINTNYVSNIIDSMNDSLFVIDERGLVVTNNRALRDLLEYDQVELRGKVANSLFSEPMINEDNTIIFADEVYLQSKSGTNIPVFVTASSLALQDRDDTENPWAVVVAQDIRKQKADELKLKQAVIQSQSAARAKSQFLATMSHEIRTPMNGVIGMAQLLQDTQLDETQKEYLDVIYKSGNGLISIINDILDFSKLDADMTELESIPFDIERVACECLQLLASSASEKGLEFIFDFHPDCPNYFLGDPSRLRQIFLNVIGNAIKFTDEGYIRFGVQFEVIDNQPGLKISVQDTGIGLKQQAIDHLFDEFTQADQNTTRKYGGTGLGLAISKKLVMLMDGDLTVESQFGKGSTFNINLQLAVAESLGPLAGNSLCGKRILLVDDHSENRRVFERLLTHLGADALILDNPDQVIDHLHQAIAEGKPFRIAILDQNMPKINGLELGMAIRRDASFKNLRLLLLSTIGLKGDVSALQKAGFDAYLNKLSRRHLLQKILEELLLSNRHDHLITQHSIEEAAATKKNETPSLIGRVLLVEDIMPNQIIARKFLENLGLEVDLADNGEIAVDRWQKGSYDLVLMDCRMPIMDGFEATRKIREIEVANSSTPVPIIALTANASADDRLLCLQAGMNDIITKPFKRADLFQTLRPWLPLNKNAELAGTTSSS